MNVVAILALVIIVLALIAVVLVVSIYNGLVTSRNRFQNAFSQIDVQLKRRHDLIPNLVETAKGYLEHERATLEAVIAARTGAVSASKAAAANPGDAGAMNKLAGAENMLTQTLGKLFAVTEDYPDLKANTTMNNLMEELTSTENKVSFARQAFNDSATIYNTDIEKVPANFIAGAFNFRRATLLEFQDQGLENAPKVSFA